MNGMIISIFVLNLYIMSIFQCFLFHLGHGYSNAAELLLCILKLVFNDNHYAKCDVVTTKKLN